MAILLILNACSTGEPKKNARVWYLESATSQPVRKQDPTALPSYPMFCTEGDDLMEILK